MPTNAPSKAPTMVPTNYGQGVNWAIGNYATDPTKTGFKVPTECGKGASVTATPDSIEPSPTTSSEAKPETIIFTSCSSLTVTLQDKSNSEACLASLKTMDIDAALGLNPFWDLASIGTGYGYVQFLTATLDCSSANSQQIGIFALFGSMTVLFSLL